MRVILTFVLIALMVYTAESGWLAGWTYRRAIVIDPSKIDENLANFPVLVKLDSTNFDFSKARADGYDIRFTSSDGVTLLKYERERHSVSGRVAEYWVRIPSVSSSINTVFYIYYGKADALDGAEPTEVWDSNYEGVWHLKEDPGGIPPQVRDATDNGNDGTSYGTMSSSNQIEGRVGKALYFDGSDDYIAFPDIDFSAYTFEFWIKTSLGGAFWSRWPSWPPRSGYLYVTDRLGVYFYDQNCGWNTQIEISSGVDLKDDRWHYIAFIYGGNNDAYLYHDNLILDGSDTDCYGVCNINSSWKLGWGDQGAGFFTGGIDEVRVSSTTRSPAWIKASYHSTNNSLVYIYAEQTDLTYLFRRSITISNSNSVSLYNYQLLLTIDTQTPISNGHLQLDGRDLRFCGSNEWNEKEWSVSYPYWVESGWNSPATRIWVRVDSLPGSSQRTIYMVYGNAGAVEVRNLSARYVDAENLMVYSRSYQVDQIDVHGGYIYTKEGGNPDSRYFKIGLNGVQVWNTNLVTGTDGGNVLVWVYVADVDNDAQDEVVGAWCRWWGPQGGIKILRASDGSIKFDTGTISHRMNEVSSWDIDNDNKLEHLAIVDYTAYQLLWFDDNLSYLRATGASGMGRPWGNYWVAFYDVDNDGIKEIIYADEDDKTVKAFTPTGSIDYSINVGHRTASPVIGDINNDGVNEIAVMGDGKISVVRFYGGVIYNSFFSYLKLSFYLLYV